jgi:hypothetical protein
MFDRATREWAMSPQIAMVRRCSRPFSRRMVSASSSACVGCSCRPSPAFRTAQFTFCARRSTAPEWGWRTTSRSGCIAFSVIAVSIRVSPFLIDDACIDMFITSAPSRLPAISKLACVRVEASKNMLIWVSPSSGAAHAPCCRVRHRHSGRRDRGSVRISSGCRGSIPRRCVCRKVMGRFRLRFPAYRQGARRSKRRRARRAPFSSAVPGPSFGP